MIITFICEVLGPENNGTTIATMNQVRYMKKMGHTVYVVCPDEDRRGQEGFLVIPRIHFSIFDSYVAKNGVTLSSAKAFKKVPELKELILKSDVIHFNFGSKLTLLCAKFAHEHNIPSTASFHTQAENFTNHVGLMKRSFPNYIIYLILNHRLFNQVDSIHYPTAFMREIFRKNHKTNAKEYIISNGTQNIFTRVNKPRPKELEGKIVITSTGRYSREKSQITLLKAMKYSKHNKDIQLVIAGDGPLYHSLKKAGEKYCVNKPILGFHSREELADILNFTDIYCHCSYADLEAISCLEAISVGITPVLADSKLSAVSGFALDKKNIYRYGDALDLARRIDYWIDHPKERKENADQYLGFSSDFELEEMMSKMEKMWIETVEDYHKNGAKPS